MALEVDTDYHPLKPKLLDWINLSSGKEFSRLLYPNPVCFLSTYYQGFDESNDVTCSCDVTSRSAECKEAVTGPKIFNKSKHVALPTKNVMVLSWITPTNNHGRFMFSINRNRYSASILAPVVSRTDSQTYSSNAHSDNFRTGIEFALSVPVKGMEELVLNTGSVSGRCGLKFQSTHSLESKKTIEMGDIASSELSNRQRKKRIKQDFSQYGIPGLIPVAPRYSSFSSTSSSKKSPALFVIQGTVAHLRCRTYAIMGIPSLDSKSKNESTDYGATKLPAIDEDHLLIMAEVLDAAVHPLYWDKKKSLFCPQSKRKSSSVIETSENEVPPYLTFLGSQTFGYVTSSTLT